MCIEHVILIFKPIIVHIYWHFINTFNGSIPHTEIKSHTLNIENVYDDHRVTIVIRDGLKPKPSLTGYSSVEKSFGRIINPVFVLVFSKLSGSVWKQEQNENFSLDFFHDYYIYFIALFRLNAYVILQCIQRLYANIIITS